MTNLLHSEKPKLYTVLAFLSVIGLIYFPEYQNAQNCRNKSCLSDQFKNRESMKGSMDNRISV